jgi:hypothetical protein
MEHQLATILSTLTASGSGLVEFLHQVHICSDKVAPRRNDGSKCSSMARHGTSNQRTDVKSLCSVKFGIEVAKLLAKEERKTTKDGEHYYNPSFQLKVKFGSAVISFTVFYKGEQVAFTEADYSISS